MDSTSLTDKLNSFADYELICFFKYRLNKLNLNQKNSLIKILSDRDISEANFDSLQKNYLISSIDLNTCPRCKCTKLFANNKETDTVEKIYNIMLYNPSSLRREYECLVCGNRFKKWISFKEIFEKIKNR